MREFTAMIRDAKGGTQTVTVKAYSEAEARRKLDRLGYASIVWIL